MFSKQIKMKNKYDKTFYFILLLYKIKNAMIYLYSVIVILKI